MAPSRAGHRAARRLHPRPRVEGLIVPVGAWVFARSVPSGAAVGEQRHRFTVVGQCLGQTARARSDRRRRAYEASRSSGFDPHSNRPRAHRDDADARLRIDLARLALLKATGLGVRIAIDDFGTGYSSLAYCASSRSTSSRSINRSCQVSPIRGNGGTRAHPGATRQGSGHRDHRRRRGDERPTLAPRDRTRRHRTGVLVRPSPLAVVDLDRLLLDSAGKPEWLSVARNFDDD